MREWFNTYFSVDYLWTPVTGTKYQKYYLYLSVAILAVTIGYRVFLAIKGKRPEVFKPFDALWFWGGLSFGAFGLFIYFARTQGLPIFSTRLVSYVWLVLIPIFIGYLIYYYQKKIPEGLTKYHESRRKAKYLKK